MNELKWLLDAKIVDIKEKISPIGKEIITLTFNNGNQIEFTINNIKYDTKTT